MKFLFSLFCLVFFIAKNGAYAADSYVEVLVKLSPVGSYVARTSDVKGMVSLKGDKVITSNIVLLAKTLKTGIALRDKHTQERLQVDKFPEIILLSGEGSSGKGNGVIKIKGIEKQMAGTYQVEGKMIKAQFKLSIKDFGIEKARYLGVGVKDEVEIKVQLPLTNN